MDWPIAACSSVTVTNASPPALHQLSPKARGAMSVSSHQQQPHQFSCQLQHLPSRLPCQFQPRPQRLVVPCMGLPCPRSQQLHPMMTTSVSALTSSVPTVALTPLLDSNATTFYYAPCFMDEEQCPTPFIFQPPTQSRGFLLPWILHPLLFLICAYSTCHQSLKSNTPLVPTRPTTMPQAVQSYVFPTPSVCVGTASMAHPPVSSSLGCILCATLQPPATHACIDSDASCDMCPIKEFFEDYIPYTNNSHITVANRRRIKVAVSSTLHIILGGHPVHLCNCLHVPDLDMFLLSTRIH